MKIKFIEATNPSDDGETGLNWGKFMLLQLGREEWTYKSQLPVAPELEEVQRKYPLLGLIGYSRYNVWVFDLQTRQGAAFIPHGSAGMDLEQTKIWVCPMFEPFLEWLYRQDLTDITTLPAVVELVNAPGAYRGYQREGTQFFSDGAGI